LGKLPVCPPVFLLILVTVLVASAGIVLLARGVEVNALAQGALPQTTQWLWIDTQPSNWEADTLPLSYFRPWLRAWLWSVGIERPCQTKRTFNFCFSMQPEFQWANVSKLTWIHLRLLGLHFVNYPAKLKVILEIRT